MLGSARPTRSYAAEKEPEVKRDFPPIDARQRELLRRRLADRAQVLLDEISAGLRGGALALDPREPEPDDNEAAVTAASADRDAVELAGIEAALERMREGTYGLCADCGVALPWARLDARPEAFRCLDCEAAGERGATPHASL
jgi:RNA polymerase-binding transcription factor DksA